MKKILLIAALLITFAGAAAFSFYTKSNRVTVIQNDRRDPLADGLLASEKKSHTAVKTSRCNHYHRKNYE